jgi:prepilin-type N-terminal cleavage/methylation domain-containing protein
MKRRTYDNRGFSLIEVLTVMVIILIGIMSVIRLFPGGFLINRKTEELTIATRLAKLEMERMKIGAANLPRAIVPVSPVANGASPLGYSYIVAQDVSPEDIGTVDAGPFGIDPYYLSGANRSGRRIIGETVRIPVPSPIANNQRGAVYMLANGPFYDVQWMGSADSIFVSGAPMNRSIQDSNNPDTPIVNGRSSYAIDYDDKRIAFTPEPRYARSFLLTYSYYDTANQTQTVLDEAVTVAAGQSGWIPIPVPNGSAIVPESDIVARKFVRLQLTDQWAFERDSTVEDPYEFKVLSQPIGGFANVGVLAFSPVGREYTERSGGDSEPLTARIDYDVLDWHIIKEDRPLPGAPPFDVRLSLKQVKKTGDFEADNTPYTGLIRKGTTPTADVLAYDVASGQLIPETGANNVRNYTIDYREGIIHFSDTIGMQFASSTVRFFYKATGDWSLQIQKAVDTYRKHTAAFAGDDANAALGEYYLGGGAAGGVPSRMYFPVTEAGKTVIIREIFSRNVGGGTGQLDRAKNETFRINDNPGQFETIGGRTLTWLDIDPDPNDGVVRNWALQDPVQPAVGVLGISFRSRVMWSDTGQIVDTGNGPVSRQRWRKVDVDNFLTRTSN